MNNHAFNHVALVRLLQKHLKDLYQTTLYYHREKWSRLPEIIWLFSAFFFWENLDWPASHREIITMLLLLLLSIGILDLSEGKFSVNEKCSLKQSSVYFVHLTKKLENSLKDFELYPYVWFWILGII